MMISRLANRVAVELHAFRQVRKAGMLGLGPPSVLRSRLTALRAYGPVGGAVVAGATSHPERAALIDERGTLTFGDLDRRANALANAWRARGIADGARIGILCRNHRGAIDATLASAKLGTRALYLNTDFSGPQARDVCRREDVQALVYDEEFSAVLSGVPAPSGRFLAWTEQAADAETLDSLIGAGADSLDADPAEPGTLVMLTSGTTGTPKGAQRPQPKSLALPGGVLSKIPFRGKETVYVAPPMFHGWGLLTALITIGLGATLATRRRFDAKQFLDDLERHRAAVAVVVPVMLKRVLALGNGDVRSRDLSALRIIATAGAQLEGALAVEVMDTFGDILYNLYGSTECAYATIATPADLRAAPGCAGRPPYGTTVKILSGDGVEVPTGQRGGIFVSNVSLFNGYTDGANKKFVGGMMSTGDVGHFDDSGRLFVDGRDDDMVVSGGENVFPQEVEELLIAHRSIRDVAVVGVPDEEFGRALRAFVVLRSGHTLTEDEVRQHVRENLARYKVPRSVVFLEELPRNPTGKVLKRQLAERTS
jgi:fatty-acyl-CoA synthase